MREKYEPRKSQMNLRVPHVRPRGRNIQHSGGSMPLFTVTMKSNGSTSEKDHLFRAIHADLAPQVAGTESEDVHLVTYIYAAKRKG